jgi:adenylate cyclase
VNLPEPLGEPRSLIRRAGGWTVTASWVVAGLLPLLGLSSLLLRSRLDPSWDNPRLHFVLFLVVGGTAAGLASAAGYAAERRGDARVLLLSLAFMVTGGFLMLHAVGTPGILISSDLSGFKVAIPVGLLVASWFAAASAFVDLRPTFPPWAMRRRTLLRSSVFVGIGLWAAWTLLKLPPLSRPASEGGAGGLATVLASLGAVLYAVAAFRYWLVYRNRLSLLPASVIFCCVLLAEAMVGVATTGERSWHASWWEWHGLIVLAYLVILFAARREWREERFRHLYLSATRERKQEASVLFSDLAGFTPFSERSTPTEVAAMLNTYYEAAAPLISRRFGGEVEKFMGDGIMATFNSRGDEPDHALRASGAALALQQEIEGLAASHPGWPRLRVGVNSGDAVVREMGGHGYVAYTVIGDMVNLASRLEGQAPVGGVLIGAETYHRLPDGVSVEALSGLRVKGKDAPVNAFILHALPEPVSARRLMRRGSARHVP